MKAHQQKKAHLNKIRMEKVTLLF